MSPYPSEPCRAAARLQWSVRDFLRAAATFRRSEQPETYGHVHPHGHATAKLSRAFAAALAHSRGRTADRRVLDEIELGAYLHDIGKYLVPASVLLKPGPLSPEERASVSLHPAYGAEIISGLACVTDTVYRVVLCHHERWDGEGYPGGLGGTRIPFAARLVAACDVYTSLRARRSYKPPLSRLEAARVMEEMAGRELDPDLTRDFVRLLVSKQEGRR
ncbi:MAG TPA: HD domain-containing phosphohydrolase [Pyrinomonadaceae bacterium]|nr:HD domain-containing phosphohydrolase [Pyrinomonadaceae bacterium]